MALCDPAGPGEGLFDSLPCQEETLSQIVFGLFVLFGVPRLFVLLRGPSPAVPRGALYWSKLGLVCLLILSHIGQYVNDHLIKEWCSPNDYTCSRLSFALGCVALIFAVAIVHYEHLRCQRSSSLLLLFWLLSFAAGLAKLKALVMGDYARNVLGLSLYAASLGFTLLLFVLEIIPKSGTYYTSLDDEPQDFVTPEETANIFSRITFYWMDSLMKLGYKKNLDMDDLWNLKRDDRASTTGANFQSNWDAELMKKSPSLLRACVKTYGVVFGSAAIFKIAQDIMAFIQPMFLKQMMEFARSWSEEGQNPQPLDAGFIIAGLMLITAVTQTIMLHQYFHICLVTGMRVRSAMVTTVYRKSLVLSNLSRQSSTVGEIVNLQSVDAGRLADLCSYLHIMWSGPFQIAMAIYFLYQTLGPSIFGGVAVMILMIPINAVLATKSRKLNKAQMANKDSRTKMMDELLNGIKVIKLYAWERPFLKKIFGVREAELHTLKKLGYLSAVQSFTWACTPFLVSFVSFAVYAAVSDEPLTSSKVFVCISLFNLLQFPLTVFPSVIMAAVEASVAVNRLEKFLVNEELDKNAVIHDPVVFQPTSTQMERVLVRNGCFRWSKGGSIVLENITFSVRDATLFAIVGSVGAGKSSVISAILGEMYRTQGEVHVRGSTAYVPQNAWIMNSTLKENILFGRPFDPAFYNEVIEACGLKSDLEVLPGGDQVEIGERGINLSGGQKQRVSLARAVYSRADIFLFDDPLSAVDAHVGRHIFNKVIGPNGILKKKARIFVTHGIHFLPETDEVMMLQDGRVSQIGKYTDLMAQEGPLLNLMKEYGKRKEAAADEEEIDTEEVISMAGSVGSQTTGTVRSRRPSIQRRTSLKQVESGQPKQTLTTKEEDTMARGSVDWSCYVAYAKACSIPTVVVYLVIAVMSQVLSVLQNVYLADWAAENDQIESVGANNGRVLRRLGIYGALGLTYSLTVVGQVIFVWVACGIRSARLLHAQMLENVVRAPQQLFDTTPLGRIMNRFSKDVYTVDEVLPRVFQGYFRTMFAVLSVLAVNLLGSPMFLGFAIPLGFLYAYFQSFYLSTSRELKRLDSTSRSPIYAHFSETLGGVSTIRAYNQEARFMHANESKVDNNMRAYYPSISSNRWLAVRLEFIGSLVVFGSALFSVITIMIRGRISASIVGLMLTYSLNVTQTLNWMVRQSCEIETNIVSVERMKEYIELPQEAAYEIPHNTPPQTWPDSGRIDFSHYSTRYRPGLDLVLKDVSFGVKSREKIGIVGRTGAGKSSLTLSLFRLIEAATGTILIDDIDISRLGLFDLRSRLTIIPQDPVLFSGTIRDNLDPFGVHDDVAIWRALDSASLKPHVTRLEKGLDAVVLQGGENFSVGQRQLICLARALLRKTHILVLDEATAAIDVETDNIIQSTIREEFKDCTILTIAHRINTVMDNDRILVLERGQIAEFDSPANLLKDKKSKFYSLAKEAGQVA